MIDGADGVNDRSENLVAAADREAGEATGGARHRFDRRVAKLVGQIVR
jgi:hypothetical protein